MNWLIWALFGNDLDGVDADSEQAKSWKPHLTGWRRRVAWWCRNPFHNLLWHVLGVVDRETQQLSEGWVRVSPTSKDAADNWRPAVGGWHVRWIVKWVPLPFVSYWHIARRFEFYIGWRERGNLGASFRRRK